VYLSAAIRDIEGDMTKVRGKKTADDDERLEDIGTARIVRRARAALATATGKERLLPKRVVDRLVSGANPAHIFHKPTRRRG
jgi:hypothetical protein